MLTSNRPYSTSGLRQVKVIPLFITQTSRILASLVLESEQLSRAPLYDDDEIDHDKTDTFKPWSTSYSDTDILSLIHLSGDEDLQSRLRTLCTEFADIFSNDLPKEAADTPPFTLIVNDTKWKVNRAPPRSQSSVKQTALFNTIYFIDRLCLICFNIQIIRIM